MRLFLLTSLLLVGCTAENPDYLPPSLRALYDHDAGVVRVDPVILPSPDLAQPPDLVQLPPDLLPEYLSHVGEPCSSAPAEPMQCLAGKVCLGLGASCTRSAEPQCCQDHQTGDPFFTCAYTTGNEADGMHCCSGGLGRPCRNDLDCCFDQNSPDKPHCAAGVCSR